MQYTGLGAELGYSVEPIDSLSGILSTPTAVNNPLASQNKSSITVHKKRELIDPSTGFVALLHQIDVPVQTSNGITEYSFFFDGGHAIKFREIKLSFNNYLITRRPSSLYVSKDHRIVNQLNFDRWVPKDLRYQLSGTSYLNKIIVPTGIHLALGRWTPNDKL